MVATIGGSVKDRMTHYTQRDAPQLLRLLLGIAETSERPVALDYLDTPSADYTIERRKVVRVIGHDRDWLRIVDATGREQTLNAWDVVEAVLLDGPEYGEAA